MCGEHYCGRIVEWEIKHSCKRLLRVSAKYKSHIKYDQGVIFQSDGWFQYEYGEWMPWFVWLLININQGRVVSTPIINIFLSKQIYFISYISFNSKYKGVSLEIVYEIKTKEKFWENTAVLSTALLFVNYFFRWCWGNKKRINDVCKSSFRNVSCAEIVGKNNKCLERKHFCIGLIK